MHLLLENVLILDEAVLDLAPVMSSELPNYLIFNIKTMRVYEKHTYNKAKKTFFLN